MDFWAEILDFESKPTFVMIGESAELVLVCGKREGKLQPENRLHFSMTLFGRTMDYFREIVYAIIKLGQSGIVKFDGRYTGSVRSVSQRLSLEELRNCHEITCADSVE